jgi:AraC-like DNA-binding protein
MTYREMPPSPRLAPWVKCLWVFASAEAPLVLRATGPTGVLGVRFHPDGAHRFAPCPLRTLTDCRIAIDDWWPDAGRTLANAMGGHASDAERVAIAEAFVHDRIARDGTCPWTEAAVAAGYYDQSHFIRDFRRYVGCTPSAFLGEAGELAEALAAPR